ncbi:MAG: hypothetical protein LC723_06685 [Actinobacteria bacterium]|nr:hypothetical protein [Actinomycetota bacterium]
MKRRTFDIVMSTTGAVMAMILVVGGGLAFWGYSFANTEVRTQLAAQKIYFPPKGSEALKPAEIGSFLNKYAGQQLVTGEQAKAYSDHFIAVHLKSVSGGKTYAEVSELARANPTDAKLQGQVQILFRGETLRGLLLNAYAFWKMGQLALIASIGAFVAAGLMTILTLLGFWHARKISSAEEFLAPRLEIRSAA